MRKLAGRFLFAPLFVPSFIGTTPARADAGSVAAFVKETCLAHVEDPAELDALAKEKGWQQIGNLAGNAGGSQLNSTQYRATQGSEAFVVAIVSLGQAKGCVVMFGNEQDVKHDEFIDAISAGLELKPVPGMTVARNGVHIDSYGLQSDQPKKKMVQITWNDSSNALSSVTVLAAVIQWGRHTAESRHQQC